MKDSDARAFLEVHRAAVRGIAAQDYSPDVIEAWAPVPVTAGAIDQLLLNSDNEIRLVAELDGLIVGIGALVLETCELRACYVEPGAARSGVGSALVREIERIATDRGLSHLQLQSSITAEPFYLALGYSARHRGEHRLSSGQQMACVKMEKALN